MLLEGVRVLMADLTELIDRNEKAGYKVGMRVSWAHINGKFVIRYYRGTEVVHEEVAHHQRAHLVMGEMHMKFHWYLQKLQERNRQKR